MLLGFLIRPTIQPKGQAASRRAPVGLRGWRWFAELALSGLRLFIAGGACGLLRFSAIYWQAAGYSASAVGYLGRWAWWRKSLSLR